MRLLVALAFCFLVCFSEAQETLRICYYAPLKATAGGYLEQTRQFELLCNLRQSFFVGVSPEQLERNFQAADMAEAGRSWIYKDLTAGCLTQYAVSVQANGYIIEDELHPMHWIILEDTKTIEGIPVQKARCEHRGRWYTAWFAPSIPLPNGPWKLGGLPGLILEAYDDRQEVVFLFKSMQPLAEQKIEPPTLKGRNASLKTYLKLSEQELKQYLELIEGQIENWSGEMVIDLYIGKCASWEYPK